MYRISTLNKIAPIGLSRFSGKYEIFDGAAQDTGIAGSTAVLVRSQAMHDMEFDDQLLAIARAGAGVNNIPLDRCADQGIVVFNTPGANANSVAELVICSMIMAARNVDSAISWEGGLKDDPKVEDISKTVEKGKSKFAGFEIKGKTLGLVGLGAVGRLTAAGACALGMKVLGFDPYLSEAQAKALEGTVEVRNTLAEMLPECDFVSLHLPATDGTKGMINASLIDSFKDGAVLINFSRDKLVVEKDVLAALDSGKLRHYSTDFATPGILGDPRVTCTPHLGASTEEAEDNCAIMAADQLMNYIETGAIKNSVNFPAISLDMLPPGENEASFTTIEILTKGEPEPAKLLSAMFADKSIYAAKGAVRGEYGCALGLTKDEITEVPAVEGVVRVRVIKRD
ncbi:MAG: 3-phosphoglycerate dehydrogenase [Clostridia bacterium]|nr:3-phosphoglycerate dehydrogenase [Clostridia bacterium]